MGKKLLEGVCRVSPKTAAIVVTACGKRKSLAPSQQLCAGALPLGDTASVARRWVSQLGNETVKLPARDLYQGRGFREAECAAASLGNKMYVISAGLGLVPVEMEIPSYALSVANGADNILSKLLPAGEVLPSSWWRELTNTAGSLTFREMFQASSGPVLIASGSAYLAMIGHDLAELDSRLFSRIRLFTASLGPDIREALQPMVMPYDRRLEALPNRSGTMSDFAQRALRHFAETILPEAPEADSKTHAQAVRAGLAGVQAPARKRGTSMTDDELVALIITHWKKTSGKSAAMLRALRDSFGVACEQKRFKKLFAVARLERSR